LAVAAIAVLLTQWPWFWYARPSLPYVYRPDLDVWWRGSIAFNERFVIALGAEVSVAVVWFLWNREQRFNRGEG
jgi:hypothetical protein